MSIHDQKLSPWAGILGEIATNAEARGDEMLAWSLLHTDGLGEGEWMGISQFVQGHMGVPTKHRPRGLNLVREALGSEFGSGSEGVWAWRCWLLVSKNCAVKAIQNSEI